MLQRALSAAAIALALAPAAEARTSPAPLRIEVLSNRADLISAGDALVAIPFATGVDPSTIQVRLGAVDVTGAFAMRPDGRFEGLVGGLAAGPNTLTATLPDGRGARLEIDDHPNGGPVFSGPQVQPWKCEDGAVDAQCNRPVQYELRYKSSLTGQFAAYDPKSPPPDMATTTTDQGVTVPYIVRLETGYQDRDQYQTAVLYDPSKPWAPWDPQKGWNHKLLITHGVSCGIDHQSGTAPDVMDDAALSRGFAVLSTALDYAGHNCNLVTEAESLVMAKERLIEEYGAIRYTIGTGCSGGSLAQQQIANAYPGVYQGILPQCSFPDAWSTGQQLAAYHLLRLYFENPGKWEPGVTWNPASVAAVEGHPNHVNSIVFDSVYWTDLGVPDDGCAGVPADQDYDAQKNPGGVRCTLADYMINVFGPRPESVWTPAERTIGHGFAGLPLGDVGVQWGLEALRRGQITPEQFVDLNDKVGGVDIDINWVPQRTDVDQPALRNAYLSGAINSTNNMDQVAIIDLRGPDPGAFHDAYRTWAVRARLEREQGHFPKNHVIWFGEAPLIGDPQYTTEGLLAMDRWLTKVEADSRAVPLSQKVADDRPADIQDRCTNIPGVDQVVVPGVGKVCENESAQTRFATPAMVAGEGVATDTNRCALKPLRQSDYYPTTFSADQWGRLEKAFPTGVCDWSKPGVDQVGTVPWRTYQDAAGQVVYGGRALGPAPSSQSIAPRATRSAKRSKRSARRSRRVTHHRRAAR